MGVCWGRPLIGGSFPQADRRRQDGLRQFLLEGALAFSRGWDPHSSIILDGLPPNTTIRIKFQCEFWRFTQPQKTLSVLAESGGTRLSFRIQEVEETEGLGIQGQVELHSEYKNNLGFMRTQFKKNRKRKTKRGWRDGTAVKSNSCPSKDLGSIPLLTVNCNTVSENPMTKWDNTHIKWNENNPPKHYIPYEAKTVTGVIVETHSNHLSHHYLRV